MENDNIPFYIAAILTFLSLKFGYRLMSSESLIWLLKPVSLMVEAITGARSVYLPEGAYYFKQLNVVIDKSCSGFNFWLLCFLMLNGLAINNYHTIIQKTGVLLTSLFVAYLFTLFVNSCRIITSIAISNFNLNLIIDVDITHQSIGVATNLTFLIIIYLTTNHILIKKQNAKYI